mmetsp:Transcript_5788/g.18855  ORF Transcript_5788/g.18855 Transcript_5788/m.18855 type:complete len:243 (-) Transcript_5788:390-1118(-)
MLSVHVPAASFDAFLVLRFESRDLRPLAPDRDLRLEDLLSARVAMSTSSSMSRSSSCEDNADAPDEDWCRRRRPPPPPAAPVLGGPDKLRFTKPGLRPSSSDESEECWMLVITSSMVIRFARAECGHRPGDRGESDESRRSYAGIPRDELDVVRAVCGRFCEPGGSDDEPPCADSSPRAVLGRLAAPRSADTARTVSSRGMARSDGSRRRPGGNDEGSGGGVEPATGTAGAAVAGGEASRRR